VSDAQVLAEAVVDAFEGYREFAPEGWHPPTVEGEAQRIEPLLDAADLWCVVAERDGRVVGHSAFQPARTAIEPVESGHLAHLRALFVDPEWWGTGLAADLHSRVLDEATGRGYRAIRLFTPAAQARARRFYEREGWRQDGEPRDSAIGLLTVEYRRALP
jgi:GNAT superfamily N-acetyltransferase